MIYKYQSTEENTEMFKLLTPSIEEHASELPDQVLRQMLEQMSALSAENHGFEEVRLILRETFDRRRSEPDRKVEGKDLLFEDE